MSVTTTANRIAYNGDGVSVLFAIPFPFLANTDINVYVGGVLQSTGFTTAGAGTGTGNVTFITAPAVGVSNVLIVRNPDTLQQTVLSPNDPFPAKVVETMADKAMIGIQRLLDFIGRSLSLADSDSATSIGALPDATTRANAFLGFDGSGNPVALAGSANSPVSVAMAPVVSAATIPASRALYGVAPRATRIDIATAASVNLTTLAPDTDDIRFTGSVTVNGIVIAVGRVVRCTAVAAFQLTNNAGIVTGTGGNLAVSQGDSFMLRANAANTVEVLCYTQSNYLPTFVNRAWVNFNGTGTVAIRGSGNVSSITDNGTGDYTVNFTTAMPDVNYAVHTTARQANAVFFGVQNGVTTYATGSVRVNTADTSGNGIDSLYVNVSVFR